MGSPLERGAASHGPPIPRRVRIHGPVNQCSMDPPINTVRPPYNDPINPPVNREAGSPPGTTRIHSHVHPCPPQPINIFIDLRFRRSIRRGGDGGGTSAGDRVPTVTAHLPPALCHLPPRPATSASPSHALFRMIVLSSTYIGLLFLRTSSIDCLLSCVLTYSIVAHWINIIVFL